MGFNALFEREDVLGILQRTLEIYHQECLGEKIYIGYQSVGDALEYVIVPRLGMIMQPYPCKKIRRHYYDSYNIRGNTVKNIAAKVMVFIATHSKDMLSMKKHLYIARNSLTGKNTVYSVCNRTIRIFDFDRKETVSIQKSSFSSKYFKNQLDFRIKYKYIFIPSMLEWGETWFRETLLDGKMLARLTDENQYSNAVIKALEYMKDLAEDTIETKKSSEYIRELLERNTAYLDMAEKNKAITNYDIAREYLEVLGKATKEIKTDISTVMSHGDLQGGNILVDREKVWIIDWETSGRRSCWFDAITILYSTRYHGGIRKLVDQCDLPETKKKLTSFYKCGWKTKDMIAVFLLEDMMFYFEDMLELPKNAGSLSFDNYMKEINEIDWNVFFGSEVRLI